MVFKEIHFSDIKRITLPKNLIAIKWYDQMNSGSVFRLPGGVKVLLRWMEEKDISDVVGMEQEIFPSPWSRESFLFRLGERNFNVSIVAEIDNQLVGYTVSYIFHDEMHVSNLAVTKDYRQNQIGELLLWVSLQIGIELNCLLVHLEVRESNQAAICLYKKYGFTIIGVRKNYYQKEHEDAILMMRQINWETPYGLV